MVGNILPGYGKLYVTVSYIIYWVNCLLLQAGCKESDNLFLPVCDIYISPVK